MLQNIEEKKITLGLFLDLKKAFDCVQHDVLFQKLPFYGIRGVALELLKSYLTNRTQFTSINGVISETQYIRYGVPQGSILGPILFLLYINDIVHIKGYTNMVLYADDTNVFFSGVNVHDLFGQANTWLDRLCSWLTANKLQLNVSKTKYMLFKSKGTQTPIGLHLQFQGAQIQHTSSIRFLGVVFDENLSWSPHIDALRVDISRAVGILNKLR